MPDRSRAPDESAGGLAVAEGAELRTIAFRLRELQRLVSMRVEQENRRMEAEGLDPVTRPRFLNESDAGADRQP